jgi:hypothetical protein
MGNTAASIAGDNAGQHGLLPTGVSCVGLAVLVDAAAGRTRYRSAASS